MDKQDLLVFYNEITFIVKLLIRNKRKVCLHQRAFANIFNKYGIYCYNLKNKPKAKAYFWIADLLGNSIAYKNFISI